MPCPRQPLSPLACHVLSLLHRLLEAARAVAAGGSVMGNCLAPRRGWLFVGNAKDVPGRGSQGWDVARAHVAAAAQRGPGASPGSCSSAGLGLECRLCAAASLSAHSPKKLHSELEAWVPRLGLAPALGGQASLAHPGCPAFASGAVPSQFSHLCLPGALCTAPCPSWLHTRHGEHEAAASTGEGTLVSPKQGDRGVLTMELLAHQEPPRAFGYGELGWTLAGVWGQVGTPG